MTWTDMEKYSDLFNIFLFNMEGKALQISYKPTKDNIIQKGEEINIRLLTATVPENVDDNIPTDQKANTLVTLTSYTKRDSHAFTQGQRPEYSTPADKAAIMGNHTSAYMKQALQFMYTDIANNGTDVVAGSATPTGAQIEIAISEATAEIDARDGGGTMAGIVFTTTAFAKWVRQVGTLFQRSDSIIAPQKTRGALQGFYMGYTVYVTTLTLNDGEATPTNSSAIVWAQDGFAYAPMELEFNLQNFDVTAKDRLTSRFFHAQGVITNELCYNIKNA